MSEAVVFIPLTQGKVAVIDFDDFDERVRPHQWCAHKGRRTFYAARTRRKSDGLGSKTILLHRVITNCPDGLEPDHKNGDGLDNRRENLRVGTHQKNRLGSLRKIAGVSSQFRGVCWHKTGQKWNAQIECCGHKMYLGLFSVEEDAARAYNKKAIELGFPEEALNFPRP